MGIIVVLYSVTIGALFVAYILYDPDTTAPSSI